MENTNLNKTTNSTNNLQNNSDHLNLASSDVLTENNDYSTLTTKFPFINWNVIITIGVLVFFLS